jgi:hypothetical protein
MHLDGILAKLMVSNIAPNIYRKYVTTNAYGEPVLYIQLEKALYGMMKRLYYSIKNSSQTSNPLVLFSTLMIPALPTK